MRLRSLVFPGIVILLSAWGWACTRPGASYRDLASAAPAELPWEVRGAHGEMLLPDVFYAEASQNEQVMPLSFDVAGGRRYQIDRLIYPTIGNPNLVSKASAQDVLEVVLRLEETYLSSELSYYLVSREKREVATEAATALKEADGHEVIKITPTTKQVDAQDPDMPEAFKRRHTVRAVFGKEALQAVGPGLYDLRFEAAQEGQPALYEYQYNAVRIFDENYSTEHYSIINITDTQVSLHSHFTDRTLEPLERFVRYVNGSQEPAIRDAAFITFSGDLHNGGSPGTIKPRDVAQTYNREAAVILKTLKLLKFPVFLIPGNHDGYASMGHPPRGIFGGLERALFETLDQTVTKAASHEWPGFTLEKFQRFVAATEKLPGGRHVDLFAGRYARKAASNGWSDWTEIPEAERNLVLYDGFYQWRRTYGPLYYSWNFGRNHFAAINTYELRQHWRSGWGMYTINYGGSMSRPQLAWLKRDLAVAQAQERDITLMSHHDPRGGHRGKGYPYYFNLVNYHGLESSAWSFLAQDHLDPIICKKIPSWITGKKFALGCAHDGLQEWMRADSEFECEGAAVQPGGNCGAVWDSGHALIDLIAATANLRTVLSGHTHANSTEVLQPGAELVPKASQLDESTRKVFASLETADPGREEVVSAKSGADLANGEGEDFKSILAQPNRELAIIRSTTSSAIVNQLYQKRNNMGFSVFTVVPRPDDRRGYSAAQINEVDLYVYVPPMKTPGGSNLFDHIGRYQLARDQAWHVGGKENPLTNLFREK
ncbi:MAG: metallophosphoesterase [Deltaproteobacteria bacterium]|nr:metallophosphoesterase [Deltaproteobacteria bacterium]